MQLTTPDALCSERELQRAAVELLRAVGWKVFEDRVAFRSDPGWLDLYAVHEGMRRTIHVELKTEKGKLSAAQAEWIRVHLAVGHEVILLRPSGWDAFVRLVVPPERLPAGSYKDARGCSPPPPGTPPPEVRLRAQRGHDDAPTQEVSP